MLLARERHEATQTVPKMPRPKTSDIIAYKQLYNVGRTPRAVALCAALAALPAGLLEMVADAVVALHPDSDVPAAGCQWVAQAESDQLPPFGRSSGPTRTSDSESKCTVQ